MGKKQRARGMRVFAVVLGLALVAVLFGSQLMEQFAPTPTGEVIAEELVASGDCEVEPYLEPSILDEINPGDQVSELDYEVRQNGAYKGNKTLGSAGSKFGFGDEMEIIVSKSNYLDKKVSVGPLKCGKNDLDVTILATDASTLSVKNSDGDAVTDNAAGGATNQSQSSTTINMDGLKITAPADKSSGDLVIAIESTNKTEVNDIILSGRDEYTGTRDFYSVQGGNSLVKWFEVPALQDGQQAQYGILIEPKSGEAIGDDAAGHAMYATAYSKQHYKERDGSFQYGIEDTDGNTKFEDQYDYDWMIS